MIPPRLHLYWRPACSVVVHPEYNADTSENDFALVRLDAAVDFEKHKGIRKGV